MNPRRQRISIPFAGSGLEDQTPEPSKASNALSFLGADALRRRSDAITRNKSASRLESCPEANPGASIDSEFWSASVPRTNACGVVRFGVAGVPMRRRWSQMRFGPEPGPGMAANHSPHAYRSPVRCLVSFHPKGHEPPQGPSRRCPFGSLSVFAKCAAERGVVLAVIDDKNVGHFAA